MLKTRCTILLIGVCATLCGQGNQPAGDGFALLTTPYSERPLQLYRGQLQGNAGYLFGVRTKLFDGSGRNVHTKDVISETHRFSWEVKYGITDFLEVETGSMFARTNVLSIEEIYPVSDETLAYVETLEEHRGFTDWYLGASLRLPRAYRHFDLSVGGGVYLPVAAYKSKEPQHTFSVDAYEAPAEIHLNYHRTYPNGTGVPVFRLATAVKATAGRFAFQGSGRLLFPAREAVNIRWRDSVTGTGSFSSAYASEGEEYALLPNRTLNVDAVLHYRVNGWFDAYLGGAYLRAAGGWTEYYGDRYATPAERLTALTAGFSIQASPNLVIYETTTFPLSGKNTDGMFQVSLTASFNLFPFLKNSAP
ncbi:MAG: hypothetical protein LBR08_04620 [Bacteroidales bacterium]|jgi:hypothetical protein|nr:hypothetical protein [Bacteroidales bacterium]